MSGLAASFFCGMFRSASPKHLLSDVDGNSAHLAAGWSSGEAPGRDAVPRLLRKSIALSPAICWLAFVS